VSDRITLSDDMAAIAFVQNSHLCKGLDTALLSRLLAAGALTTAPAGTTICAEGATDDTLFMIMEGKVEIRQQHADGAVEIATLDRPAIFGERSVLTAHPRSATVIARVDCRLVLFPGEVIRDVANAAPKFGWLLASLMAGRTKDTAKKLGV
jgi:CRP-like cAMP-binding protein